MKFEVDVNSDLRQTWTCRIGVEDAVSVPSGGDGPMRDAVQAAFKELTGREPDHCFSGWGDSWDEGQLAVIENRLPQAPSAEHQIDQLAKFIMSEIPGEPSQSEGAVDTAIRLMRAALVERAGEPVAWISATQLRRLAESRAADPSNLTNVGWAVAYATDNIPGMVPLHALNTAPGASHER